MSNSLFNLIIILIPLAIFIGRTIVRARRKHAPPPSHRIPVQYPDDDVPHWERESESAVKYYKGPLTALGMAVAQSTPAIIPALPTASQAQVPSVQKPPVTAAPGQKSFNLSNLSPMKQAVVMAEVLGPPKGLRDM